MTNLKSGAIVSCSKFPKKICSVTIIHNEELADICFGNTHITVPVSTLEVLSTENVKLMAAQLCVDGLTENKGQISDGYHSFDELYEFRKMYNAVLFNEWAMQKEYANPVSLEYEAKYSVHKSWKHFDGELCFGGGWFIVSAMLPSGQISNHYPAKDWHLFRIPETEKALFPFDGHTPQDVLSRLYNL